MYATAAEKTSLFSLCWMKCSKSHFEEKNENWPENYQKFQKNQKCCSHLQVLCSHCVRHMWTHTTNVFALFATQSTYSVHSSSMGQQIVNLRMKWFIRIANLCELRIVTERCIERANITAIHLGVVIYTAEAHKSMVSVNRTHLKVASRTVCPRYAEYYSISVWGLCCLLFTH